MGCDRAIGPHATSPSTAAPRRGCGSPPSDLLRAAALCHAARRTAVVVDAVVPRCRGGARVGGAPSLLLAAARALRAAATAAEGAALATGVKGRRHCGGDNVGEVGPAIVAAAAAAEPRSRSPAAQRQPAPTASAAPATAAAPAHGRPLRGMVCGQPTASRGEAQQHPRVAAQAPLTAVPSRLGKPNRDGVAQGRRRGQGAGRRPRGQQRSRRGAAAPSVQRGERAQAGARAARPRAARATPRCCGRPRRPPRGTGPAP